MAADGPEGRADPNLGVRSVAKALTLLEELAKQDSGLRLGELAVAARLPLPTVHRLARTLEALGYIRQGQSRQYVLGARLRRLGDASVRSMEIWLRPHLDRLVAQVGESACVSMLDGDEMVCVSQVQSHHEMRISPSYWESLSPTSSAIGRVILASLTFAEARNIFERTGDATSAEAASRWRMLSQALEAIAECGYALDDGIADVGIRCVAVSVPSDAVHLAIAIAGPATRLDDRALVAVTRRLETAAGEIERDLSDGDVRVSLQHAAGLSPS